MLQWPQSTAPAKGKTSRNKTGALAEPGQGTSCRSPCFSSCSLFCISPSALQPSCQVPAKPPTRSPSPRGMTRRWRGLCPCAGSPQYTERKGWLRPHVLPQPGHFCCCPAGTGSGGGRADRSPLPPSAEAAGPASEGFSYPLSQQLKFQLNKTQPQTYSKHLLVFKENNSVKGTELCLKPYAFSFFTSLFGCKSYVR